MSLAALKSAVMELFSKYESGATAPKYAAGNIFRTPDGKLRMLVRTTDGKEAVVNPENGRLLAHGKKGSREVFTSWADRVAKDGYVFEAASLADLG